MEASLAVQSALLSQLKKLGFKVFDYPPKKVDYPFILIGNDRQTDLDVKNGDYVNLNTSITVFSTYNGKKEVKTIMEQVRQTCSELVVNGYEIVGARVDDSFTVLDDDNQVTQGVLTINFKMVKGEQ